MPWPADMFWEVTHFFETPESSGWSEKLYILQSEHNLTLQADILAYSTARKDCLNENIRITHIRLSDPAKTRDQLLVTDPDNFGAGNVAGTPLPYESALLYRNEFNDHIVNQRLVHGFTVGDMQVTGEYDLAGPTGVAAGGLVAAWVALPIYSVNQVATGLRPTPYTQKPIIDGFVSVFRSHDIGRPFGLRRGRASPTV